MQKFYAHKDTGKFTLISGFSENPDPDNLIEVETAPADGRDLWVNGEWVMSPEGKKEKAIEDLTLLDAKSIRALRSGDSAYLEELEAQAVELRKMLK